MACTYLSSGDLNADLFNSLSELIRLDSAVVIKVEVLEGLLEDGLLALSSLGLFGELVLEFSLETDKTVRL